ncbi:MAG: hypothetical protein GTO45_37535, partial [Candidatus Aminicenantes bacterium]|nr:hypothetical protein [Candidatus Aminicenantes bacterium]NIM80309.1 hypothetical protein [Candidatus Aminicenantes bacterium]NIN23855.1 hypothetical protein [Candidatus Aminicenantes bacterium]NIN47571.1 hypothetical protein [Candidatus Aminicenantes bacterium]NIN90491.1 hypothetical protein [Candidatus Aminicenantes bacterium]
QEILTDLFTTPLDEVLSLYLKNIKVMIGHYIGADDKKEKVLRLFLTEETASTRDFIHAGIAKEELDDLLRDMVRNNILYFDSTEGLYYP